MAELSHKQLLHVCEQQIGSNSQWAQGPVFVHYALALYNTSGRAQNKVLNMEMRGALNGLGFALCVGAAAMCLVLHVAAFLTIVSPVWIVPPFLLVAGAVLCSKAIEPRPRLALRADKVALLGCVLLIYAVITFVYFYKTTGGASSVGFVDGQYVSKYKDHIIRVITESEYRMFPNLWTRVMSAWIGMMAVFGAKSFALPRIFRSELNG